MHVRGVTVNKNLNELALEKNIERALVGICKEDLAQGIAQTHSGLGYVIGQVSDFNADYAIDEKMFFQFLESTQKDSLDAYKAYNKNDWKQKILGRFDKLIKKHGIAYMLKKGMALDEQHFHFMYPCPLASSSQSVKQNFASNIFSVTRQVQYSLKNRREEIDMVIFLNGLPLVTMELKNAWTNQTARYHGQKQYREDRDETQPLLSPARCLVHFAVDTDEAYMTTKLEGKKTNFLPFNKGIKSGGQGNPVNPKGYKTAYLWEEIFVKESLVNIVQHFVRLDGTDKDQLSKRTLFFPRYHQLDVVRKLISHVSEHGVGKPYLIQHSAGSGKSNSITWAAFQLIEAYPDNAAAAASRAMHQPLFDSVIVVTDRKILDKQIRDNIKDFSEVKNIIAHAHNSAELKRALEAGKKIIITTIQKFRMIWESVTDLSHKNFAIIIDEAHSSQSGEAHNSMNRAMGNEALKNADDVQDMLVAMMDSRKKRENVSYFAFTATPKNSTLEKFGKLDVMTGKYEPFHLYSMKQAIEEGFILDVLANYTTYKSFYEIQKSIEDNPLFESKKAQRILKAYVEASQQSIEAKASIMLEHFIDNVVNKKKLKGIAKAMVATQSIESAIRYYLSIKKLLEQKGNPFNIMIAFSGEKEVDGQTYTEESLNGFSESKTKDHFDLDENRILVVANKYLTGFDQPKLTTMYIDKKMTGVQCVQALSRLNRAAPKYNKRTEDLFILDFYNDIADIKAAFDDFYTSTSLSSATDVNVLNDVKTSLDDSGVYELHEIVKFNELFFSSASGSDLSPIIDTAVERFDADTSVWGHEQRVDFKVKAKQFVKIYAQVSSIIQFNKVEWEQLYWFLKFLVPKLNVQDGRLNGIDDLLESVDLSTYALKREHINKAISLDAEETIVDPQNPNPRNPSEQNDDETLDTIISKFNEKWFQGWSATSNDQRVIIIDLVKRLQEHQHFTKKYKENLDPHTRSLAFKKMLDEIMVVQRKNMVDLYNLYRKDPAFQDTFSQTLENLVDTEEV
nr:DEAD/DEAH box helicase family protein [Acinetobacter lwoffii]